MNSTQNSHYANQLRLTWIIDHTDTDGEWNVETPERIHLVATGKMCTACEAQEGDNEFCVYDGSAHGWRA